MAKKYTADFETTTSEDDCRVWAVGICELDTLKFNYSNNIGYLFNFMQNNIGAHFYFHNLKFDGEFILYELFKRGFKHTTNKKFNKPNTFKTLISDMGIFYSMEICFGIDENLNPLTVKIIDSLKIIPFSVAEVAKAFNLPIKKGELDYTKKRCENHTIDENELDYLKNDVEIMARALNTLFNEGLNKTTQGSNALSDYKKIIGNKRFNKIFPSPVYDEDIRQAYKGGWVYVNPDYKNSDVGNGIVLDVNSLYPSVMYNYNLPYGEGIFFNGQYENDVLYNLYVQVIKCQFKLKKGYLPTIQLKNNLSFSPTDYLTDSGDEEVTIYLSNVDLEIFKKHYDVYNLEYISGWKFKSCNTLFKDYIDKWIKVKNESTLSGNMGMRTLAKLMLNSLYGKFALNPNVQSKIPHYDTNSEKVLYRLGEKEKRKPIYIPMAIFITSWARHITITSAQSVFDRFLYADTDSLHLIGENLPTNLNIHKVNLGAWKHEATFTRARFLRQKSYIEEINGELHITCAGMPKGCYKNVNWDNFKEGNSFEGKLQFSRVKNGVILKPIDFTIKK